MCGRFGLEASWQELFDYFDLVGSRQLGASMPPRYNIAPTQPIVTVGIGVGGSREGQLVRWGLVPLTGNTQTFVDESLRFLPDIT